MIPERTLHSLKQYVDHGQRVGGMLEAVLCNDLFGTFSRADSEHLHCMPELVKYVYNKMPARSWGDKDAVKKWVKQGGLHAVSIESTKKNHGRSGP
jgi:hypothetical protein